MLLDLLDLNTQLFLPSLTAWFGVLSFVIILAFGVLILRNYRDYSVRTKLLSVALFIILLIVSTTTMIAGEAVKRTLTEEVGHDLQTLSHSRAFAVSELLGQQVSVLQALALDQVLQTAAMEATVGDETAVLNTMANLDAQWQTAADDDPLVRDKLENDAAATLVRFQAQFPIHRELFITDRYGGLVAATSRTTDYYQGDEVWWQAAFANGAGRVYISEPELDQSSDTFGLLMAIPIYNNQGNGEMVGILRTTYSFTELVELLNIGLQVDNSVEMVLLIGNQELPLVQDTRALQQTQLDMALLTRLKEADGTLVEPLDGELQFLSATRVKTLYHVAAVDQLDWWVLLQQPQAEALWPLGVQQRLSTLLGVLLAALSVQYVADGVHGLIAGN